ncbi:MAG: hypothetical protein GIKADHBN_00404 [Phycisphaerales bacterium]|nr:hypothetical protein [Phycisphaerales bacterium]
MNTRGGGLHLVRLFVCLMTLVVMSGCEASPRPAEARPRTLRVLVWNIWHGGREDGEAGLDRVIEILRAADADVVLMVETYGSGPQIAGRLGYRLHMHDPTNRGDNLAILSRYPIREDISVWEQFQSLGAVIDVPGLGEVAVCNVWLSYADEIWEPGTRERFTTQQMIDQCRASSLRDLKQIMPALHRRLDGREIPTIVGGDFNAMSHLDYTAEATDQYGAVIDWPVTRYMQELGYSDAYREVHPRVRRLVDRTWTPRFPDQQQDRIDYVFYRGGTLRCMHARVVDRHPALFPSDHAAVLVDLAF